MEELTIRLLGAPLIEIGGQPIYVDTRKATALLAYLALREGVHRRETLATFFWPELNERKAKGALRRTLSTLKRGLGLAAESLQSDRRSITLLRNDQVWVDVAHFEGELASCQTHGHAINEPCVPASLRSIPTELRGAWTASVARCVEALTEAVALYRGDFLAGFTLRDSEEFDEWQLFHAEHLRQQVIGALEGLVVWHGGNQEYEEAFLYARRWLALDSLNERAHRELMRLYVWDGQRNAALRQYSECVRVLESEIGVPPDDETEALHKRIRSGQEETRRALLIPATDHTVERRPFDKLRAPHHNLPTELTPFVGRELELTKIADLLLDDPNRRLLTLTGLGGIGKTRLALQVASEQLDAFPDGVFFVSLVAALTNQALISNVAQALQLTFDKNNQKGKPLSQLVGYLSDKEMLLVVDNFEQLLPHGCDVLAAIMQQAAEVKLLVTSRQRLALRGEWVVEVASLPVPNAHSYERSTEKIDQYSAVELFVQETERIRGEFDITERNPADVGRIVRLVGGIPLAIELAAAWTRLLSCAEIAAELEHTLDFLADSGLKVPTRHRSLRIVFEHTWARLTVREQDVLRRLSVFAGDFPRQAAQQVAGATLPLLLSLMDKSLLRRTPVGRLEMHPIVRQYAAEKLSFLQNETQKAHATYYLVLSEQAKPEFDGAEVEKWLDTLATEQDNLRAALTWSLAHAPEMALRMTAGIWRFWDIRAHWQEGRSWLVSVLAKTASNENSVERGEVLLGAARFALHQGENETARERFSQAEATFNALGDKKNLSRTLSEMGPLSWRLGESATAQSYLEESLNLSRQIGDRQQVARILTSLGILAWQRSDYTVAQVLLEEGLALKREFDNSRDIAISLSHLGLLVHEQGHHLAAQRRFNESLQIFRKIGHKIGIALELCHLGSVATVLGALQTAQTHYHKAVIILEEVNDQWYMGFALSGLADGKLLSGMISEAQALYKKSLSLAQKTNNDNITISSLVGLAKSLNAPEGTQDAVRVLAAAKAFQTAKEVKMLTPAPHFCEEALASARTILDEAAFDAAWAEGAAMTIEEAIDYVL
ncbi:MAG: AfsR/SARP family transcriptional regulator, partial [Ardenticatenaceae bacterium]